MNSHQHVIDLKALRTATGMGLRDCAMALDKYGSYEKAVAALLSIAPTEQRDSFEDKQAEMRKNAERYVRLRDSGFYKPEASGYGWSERRPKDPMYSAVDLDRAADQMGKWSPQTEAAPKYVSILVDGRIPANTECPFRAKCEIAQVDRCHHQGQQHTTPFSCASARGFDLILSDR